jgi:TRAP-type C4-dicarboxylate transport system permease small subunit
VIALDVFIRRMKLSVQGAMDLIEVSFCILCFFSFSYAWVKGDHISVEILVEKAPASIARLVRLFSMSIGLFIFGCLSYAGFNLAASSFKFGDTTMDLHLPHGIPQTAMVIGSMWFCLQLVVSILIELGLVDKPDLYE